MMQADERKRYEEGAQSAVMPTIPTHPDNVAQEIEAWGRRSEKIFSGWDQQIAEYASSNYDADINYKNEYPENPAFEWIDTMRSQFLSGTPQCRLRAMSDDVAHNLKSAAIKHSINRLARDQRWRRLYSKLFVDWALRRASWRYNMRPEPHADRGPLDGPVMRPYPSRVPPKSLVYDARALDWDEALFRGDRLVVSKSALERVAREGGGWDLDAIESLSVGAGLEKIYTPEQLSYGNRDDVVIYRIWFPDEQLDEDVGPEQGFFGTERVYAECERNGGRSHCGNLREIRAPQAWFGPRNGPVGMAGQHYVPDNLEPLSLLTAMRHVAKSMGIRSKTIEVAMATYKRILIESTGTRNLGQLIKTTNHNGVVKAKGFDGKNVAEFVIGGVDAPMLQAYQFDSDRLDRLSGLSSAYRGQTKSGVTATAESIAAGGISARAAGMRDSFYEIPMEMFYAMGYLVDGTEGFWMKLPPEFAQETGVDVASIRGGRQEGESFDDYEVSVEPLSMQYRTEDELRVIAEKELEMMTVGAPLMPQIPWVDWRKTWESLGEAYGIVDLPERFNYDMAEQIAGLMLGTQMMPGTAFQPSSPQPGPFNGKDRPRDAAAPTGQPTRSFGQPVTSSPGAQAARPGARPAPPSGRSSGARAGAAARR